MRALLFCVLATGACKKPAAEPAVGSAAAGSATKAQPDASAAPWTATSHPIALACGDAALPLPPPQATTKPVVDQPLKPDTPIADCRDQASVDAVCGCLAKSVATWGKQFALAGPATCAVQPNAQPDAAIVKLTDNPADTSTKTGGAALVMVGSVVVPTRGRC